MREAFGHLADITIPSHTYQIISDTAACCGNEHYNLLCTHLAIISYYYGWNIDNHNTCCTCVPHACISTKLFVIAIRRWHPTLFIWWWLAALLYIHPSDPTEKWGHVIITSIISTPSKKIGGAHIHEQVNRVYITVINWLTICMHTKMHAIQTWLV